MNWPTQSLEPVDLPFLPPPDITIDVPVPPSVNKVRKIDWAKFSYVRNWWKNTDNLLISTWQVRGAKKVAGQYELAIVVDDRQSGKVDLPNLEKLLTDYLVRIELVKDDGPKYLRAFSMRYGEAEAYSLLMASFISDHMPISSYSTATTELGQNV